jgi:hypothetical protein
MDTSVIDHETDTAKANPAAIKTTSKMIRGNAVFRHTAYLCICIPDRSQQRSRQYQAGQGRNSRLLPVIS